MQRERDWFYVVHRLYYRVYVSPLRIACQKAVAWNTSHAVSKSVILPRLDRLSLVHLKICYRQELSGSVFSKSKNVTARKKDRPADAAVTISLRHRYERALFGATLWYQIDKLMSPVKYLSITVWSIWACINEVRQSISLVKSSSRVHSNIRNLLKRQTFFFACKITCTILRIVKQRSN